MTDHAEHPAHTPVDHGLGHHVGHGLCVFRLGGEADIDAVFPGFDGECFLARIFMPARRLAGQGVKVPSMPGATQPAALDRPLTQRPALMRTVIVHRTVLALIMGQRERAGPGGDGLDPSFRQIIRPRHSVPGQCRCFFILGHNAAPAGWIGSGAIFVRRHANANGYAAYQSFGVTFCRPRTSKLEARFPDPRVLRPWNPRHSLSSPSG